MNKRRLHHYWTKFRELKPWYFLVAAVLLGLFSIFALRANNQRMVELRDSVYAADKSGKGITDALDNLRQYVYGHMNTNLASGPDAVYPPIQLKYTYDRLVTTESERVKAANESLYNDAQKYCEQLNPNDFSGRNRVPCVTQYVTDHGVKAQSVPDSLYKFSFTSPSWSPDLAGWSVVFAVVSALLAALTYVLDRWFKRELS